MPIGMLVALLTTLGISLAIFPHRGPIITCTEGSCCQWSTPDVTPVDPLVKLSLDSHALLPVYTYQKRVRKTKPVQLAIDRVNLLEFFFIFLASVESIGSTPSAM